MVGLAAATANADEQPTRIFHIGIVTPMPRSSPERVAFEDRLRELGYVEGRNVAIDYVQSNDLDRLAAAVGEMARNRIDVLLIGGQDELIKAAVTTARSVPVVTTAVDSDPLAKGYVASLSHPGGNLALSPTAMAVDAQPSGVTVVVHGITEAEANADSLRWRGQAWVRTPWTVLMHALGDAIGKIAGHAGGPNAPPDGTLRVVVAPR